MNWLRSLAAEIFPAWRDRTLLRREHAEEAGLDPLQKFRRRIAMEDGKTPAIDTREKSAQNPPTGDGGKRSQKRVAPEGEHDPVPKKDRAVKDAAPKRRP